MEVISTDPSLIALSSDTAICGLNQKRFSHHVVIVPMLRGNYQVLKGGELVLDDVLLFPQAPSEAAPHQQL